MRAGWARRRDASILLTLGSVAALAGCAGAPDVVEAPPSGDVGLALLIPEGATRYEMPADTVFHLPLLDDAAPMPAWPAAWLRHDAPPRSVCAEVVIEADGRVRSVAPMGGVPGCDDPEDEAGRAFWAEVQPVLAAWRYDPAASCRYAPDARLGGDRACAGALERTPLPVTLGYRLRFRADRPGAGLEEL